LAQSRSRQRFTLVAAFTFGFFSNTDAIGLLRRNGQVLGYKSTAGGWASLLGVLFWSLEQWFSLPIWFSFICHQFGLAKRLHKFVLRPESCTM